jgi:hypothetical protein
MKPSSGASGSQLTTSQHYQPSLDLSLWFLVFSNAVTIFVALIEGWDIGVVFVVYWIQSVIIGAVNVLRMLTLKMEDFGRDYLDEFAGKKLPKGVNSFESGLRFAKVFLAGFFMIHYGGFMYGYSEFIHPMRYMHSADGPYIALTSLVFLSDHVFSFIYNRGRRRYGREFFVEAMFKPYFRIIPMHVTIIVGSFILLILGDKAASLVLVFFLALKTYADAKTHIWEHGGMMADLLKRKRRL